MSTDPSTTTHRSTDAGTVAVQSLAAAVAAALPVPAPLQAADAQLVPPDAHPADLPLPAAAGTAVVARLVQPGGSPAGQLTIVITDDVVGALRESPLGPLDVAAAVQPAVDAGAAAIGLAAESATELTAEVALDGALAVPGAVAVALTDAAGVVLSTVVASLGAGAGAAARATPRARGLELLRGVEMEVTVELGRTRMTVSNLLSLAPGAVVELDRAAGSPADVLVNGTLIARGEVVVVDEDFGIRITEIVTSSATDGSVARSGGSAIGTAGAA